MTEHLIRITCAGDPEAPHDEYLVVTMVRALVVDGSETWTPTQHAGLRGQPDQLGLGRNRLRLQCGGARRGFCSKTVEIADGSRDRFNAVLNVAAAEGMSPLPLHAVEGMITR